MEEADAATARAEAAEAEDAATRELMGARDEARREQAAQALELDPGEVALKQRVASVEDTAAILDQVVTVVASARSRLSDAADSLRLPRGRAARRRRQDAASLWERFRGVVCGC